MVRLTLLINRRIDAGFFLLALGVLTCLFPAQQSLAQGPAAQNSAADTTRVQALLQRGTYFVLKLGEATTDLDSALLFAGQAATLSEHIRYPQGIQAAALLTANIRLEAKNYPLAWSVYTSLNDTSRIDFLGMMMRYRLVQKDTVRADLDSAQHWVSLLLPLWPAIGSPHGLVEAYQAVVCLHRLKRDNTRLIALMREGWQRLRHYNDIANENDYLFRINDWIYYDSSLITQMLPLADQLALDDERLLAHAPDKQQRAAIFNLSYIGLYISYFTKQIDAAIHLQTLAMQVNQRLHQHDAYPWYMMADAYTAQGRTKEALATALEGVRISETPAGPVDAHGYEAAAKVYYMIDDYEKSLEYADKALALYKKDPALVSHPTLLLNSAIYALIKLHKPAEALKMLQFTRQIGSVNPRLLALMEGNIYFQLDRIDSSEYYFRQAARSADNISVRYSAYIGLAEIHLKKGEYSRAKPLLDTLTADSSRSWISLLAQEILWRSRYQLDSALGNYRRAMTDQRIYQQVHDSMTNVLKNKQLVETDVRYETEKKTQHITDLEKQTALQTRLQEATVKQDRIVRNSLIAGAALLALLAFGLYNRWRARRRMSLRLEKLLGEKEWLLREIHHRVKNNLQIIISLLRLQSGELKDATAISAFEEISARVNAISLVHKKLYQEGQDMASIDMPDYVHSLVDYLKDGFGLNQSIQFNLDIAPMYLDVAQCVPLGLILNEAITNAIKYAFPRGFANSFPTINIGLKETSESWITLTIADNGIGLPAGFDFKKTGSLGLKLIQTLTLQLEGTFDTISHPKLPDHPDAGNDPGLAITICFALTGQPSAPRGSLR